MNKILEAEDILAGARHCVECVFMAAANLSSREETDPLQAVADIASTKIVIAHPPATARWREAFRRG
jgi:hypothetical protein